MLCYRSQAFELNGLRLQKCLARALPDDLAEEYALGTHPGLTIRRGLCVAGELVAGLHACLGIKSRGGRTRPNQNTTERRDEEAMEVGGEALVKLMAMQHR